jgi:hypothetical protein
LYNSETLLSTSIDVDIIAERDGQKLRKFILDSLRDLGFTSKKYRLMITLKYTEKLFAYVDDGTAKRVRSSYIADVILKNEKREILFKYPISVFTSVNISKAPGEVLLSLYGRNNNAMLKELSNRIIENLKVFLSNED